MAFSEVKTSSPPLLMKLRTKHQSHCRCLRGLPNFGYRPYPNTGRLSGHDVVTHGQNYQMAVEAYQREGTTVCTMEGRLRFTDGEIEENKGLIIGGVGSGGLTIYDTEKTKPSKSQRRQLS